MKQTFTREEVVELLKLLLERPDVLVDAGHGEANVNKFTAEDILKLAEQFKESRPTEANNGSY
jgi:hypothetical protein